MTVGMTCDERKLEKIALALNTARLVIDMYYNGMESDREWADRWLIKAHEANQEKAK